MALRPSLSGTPRREAVKMKASPSRVDEHHVARVKVKAVDEEVLDDPHADEGHRQAASLAAMPLLFEVA